MVATVSRRASSRVAAQGTVCHAKVESPSQVAASPIPRHRRKSRRGTSSQPADHRTTSETTDTAGRPRGSLLAGGRSSSQPRPADCREHAKRRCSPAANPSGLDATPRQERSAQDGGHRRLYRLRPQAQEHVDELDAPGRTLAHPWIARQSRLHSNQLNRGRSFSTGQHRREKYPLRGVDRASHLKGSRCLRAVGLYPCLL